MAPRNIPFETLGAGLRWSLASGVLVVVFAAPAYSQNLGDMARQERERKAAETSHSTHVYTNEDLAKPQILVPEDQERVAKGKVNPATAEPARETAGIETQPQPQEAAMPLGDIARRYRALKAANRKVEPPVRSQELHTPTLAYPKFAPRAVKPAAPPEPLARVRVVTHSAPVIAKAAPAEETIENGRIRVQTGDTLWKLAKQYLGRGENWTLMAEANPEIGDPSLIRSGAWVRLPDATNRTAAETSPVAAARSVHVGRGDTMWKLTQRYFGDGAGWACIARANPRIKNSDLIFVGQTLAIPGTCRASSRR